MSTRGSAERMPLESLARALAQQAGSDPDQRVHRSVVYAGPGATPAVTPPILWQSYIEAAVELVQEAGRHDECIRRVLRHPLPLAEQRRALIEALAD